MGPEPVWHMLLISLGMALAIAGGKIVISVLSAYAVVFFRFPGRQIAFWLIFVTLMLPVEVRIIPTYAVMADFGLINTFPGLTVPLIASATATLLFRQVFVAIPDELVEAARMDGARGWHRFRTITFPLLAPTTFFLLVVNLVYAAFDTFGTIYALTQGGPGQDTETLVIKVYRDGMINQDIGGSSAQSVVLMVGVIVITAIQFRFMGRRTNA